MHRKYIIITNYKICLKMCPKKVDPKNKLL